jgi:hypothetical protein
MQESQGIRSLHALASVLVQVLVRVLVLFAVLALVLFLPPQISQKRVRPVAGVVPDSLPILPIAPRSRAMPF